MLNRKQTVDGYIILYLPDHPKAFKSGGYKNWAYEHIVVMEKELDRSLLQEEMVHHLDLRRTNNNPRNLLVVNSHQHNKIHDWINRGLPFKDKFLLECTKHTSSKDIVSINRCKNCGIAISERLVNCSQKCYRISNPSKRLPLEDLLELLSKYNYSQLSKKLRVSDNAIRKWIKYYDLNPKDYSNKKTAIVNSSKKNKETKLNNIQAEQIRTKYKEGNITQQQLGLLYKVSKSIIKNIINNRIYRKPKFQFYLALKANKLMKVR